MNPPKSSKSTAASPGGFVDRQLLIAMPGLADPNFSRGVTLICQHNADGALGIIVNRPSNFTLLDVLAQLGIQCHDETLSSIPVLEGGPVHRERGFVLHETEGEWESSVTLGEHLQLTTSRDILEAIAAGRGPRRFLLALGYAGWAPGQLEDEMLDNAWLHTTPSPDVLFDLPLDQRWQRAVSHLGIHPDNLSTQAGHA